MVDTQKLRDLVYQFSFHSKPSSGNYSDPCTVQDINKVIKNLTDVLNGFIDELEENQ